MTKVINVSDDGGSNWYAIPGPDGSFGIDGEQLDDKILGQTYDSKQPGLATWNVAGRGLYKGFAGYLADLKQSGTATVATGEAMSLVTGKTYRIDDTSKEVWNADASIVVYDGVTDVTAQVESYDYLFGKVTFLGTYTVLGAVTIDMTYYPLATFGKGRGYTLTQSAKALDTSDYQTVQGNTGFRTHASGLRTISLDINGIFNAADDWAGELINRNRILIEINADGNSKSTARGWFHISNTGQEGEVGDNETETVKFMMSVKDSQQDPFGWDHASDTTLATAIQKILTAMEDQTDLDIQYLHDGTNGKEGTTVVTGATLTGDIDSMNEFSFSFVGDGATTDVP